MLPANKVYFDIEASGTGTMVVYGGTQTILPPDPETSFGEQDPEMVYEKTGELKKEAMKQKTQNRARAVLGPRKSRYM